MDTWIKRGAIAGSVVGILAILDYVIFGHFIFSFFFNHLPPSIEHAVTTILFLPLILIKPLYEVNFPDEIVIGLILNLSIWILIGAVAGYSYMQYNEGNRWLANIDGWTKRGLILGLL